MKDECEGIAESTASPLKSSPVGCLTGYLTETQLLVLGPRQYAAQYQPTWDPDSPKSVPIDEQLLADMLAYY